MSVETRFLLKNVRISYPNLSKPAPGFQGQGEAKYGVNVLIDKSDALNLSIIRQKMVQALSDKFPNKEDWPIALRKNDIANSYLSPNAKDGWSLRDGDFVDKPGYEGVAFIHATNRNKPFTLTADKHPCDPSVFYAGCYADVALEAWAYFNKATGTKGVSVSVHGLRFVRDGEAFGAAPVKASDFFDGVEDGADNPASYDI